MNTPPNPSQNINKPATGANRRGSVMRLISHLAGEPLPAAKRVGLHGLLAAYSDVRPDPGVPSQHVAFGSSGHRGTLFDSSFNSWHVPAITQALCEHRKRRGIDDPLSSVLTHTPFRTLRSRTRCRCFRDDAHLRRLLAQAQRIVDAALDLTERS